MTKFIGLAVSLVPGEQVREGSYFLEAEHQICKIQLETIWSSTLGRPWPELTLCFIFTKCLIIWEKYQETRQCEELTRQKVTKKDKVNEEI